MDYETFKKSITKSFRQSNVALENKFDILNMEVSLAKELKKGSVEYYEALRMLNEKHELGLDLSVESNYEKVISKLENTMASVKQGLVRAKEIITSIESNFKISINGLSLFMIDLIFLNHTDCEEAIVRLFIKLLQVNNGLENREIRVVFGEDCEEVEKLEQELLELYEQGDFESFKNKALQYFEYICNINYVKLLLDKHNTNKDNVMEFVSKGLDDYFVKIEIMQKENFIQEFKVPRFVLNSIICNLREHLLRSKESLQAIENNLKDLEKVDFNGPNALRFINYLIKQGIINLPKNANRELISLLLLNYKKSYQNAIIELESLLSSLTVTGFSKPSFGLAGLSAYIGFDEEITLLIYYLIFTGIRVNSEDERVYSDEYEQLHILEKQLATCFNSNLIIKREKKEEFLALYQKYLELYLSINSRIINLSNVESNKEVEDILRHIEYYIENFEDTLLDSIILDRKETKEVCSVSRVEVEALVIDPLNEYIVNNKVVKICDLEEFKVLLANSSLPLHLKQEYMKQMINLINRKTQEENNKKMNDLLCSILDEDDILLLEQAKTSGNVEAMQVVKDIEFNLELMVEDEIDEQLVGEIHEAIEVLRRILNPKVEVEEEKPKVIYFKDYFYGSLIKAQKANYKEAYNAINRIIEGNVGQDKMLFGDNLPVKVWFKGKKFKTFYTMIGEARIVIGGGLSDSIFNEMAALVNSREFLEFISSLRDVNLGVLLEEENNKTVKIMNELKKSKAVCR